MAYKGGYKGRCKGNFRGNKFENEAGFEPDPELSAILTRMWEADENKCNPGEDFRIDLQRYVNSTRQLVDQARKPLYQGFDQAILERQTYKDFVALLDNYEMTAGTQEILTLDEKRENVQFINSIMETEVMKICHEYLVEKGKAPADLNGFKVMLYNLWFSFIRRTKGDRDEDSSSFEHVFVGESRQGKFIGLHNWLQIYLLERDDKLDYHGYFKWDTIRDDLHPRLLALQFSFRGDDGEESEKPMCSTFLGTSPEFEIGAYTLCFYTKQGITDVQLGDHYEIEIATMPIGPKHIGTAYIKAARM